jgi:hypothetical protein
LNGTVDATIIALVMPWEAAVWRLFFALISAATALAAPVHVLAAGAPVRKPPVDVTAITAPSTTVPPASSIHSVVQSVTREQFFGGCGGRRIRDPHTNQCRGPADVGH